MKNHNIVIAVIFILSIALGIYAYPLLPEQVASHWDVQGNPNGYMSRLWSVILLPLIMAGMWILFFILPKIDPKRKNIEQFKKEFDTFIVSLFIFLFYLDILVVGWNLGWGFDINRLIAPGIAFILYAAGELIRKSEPNWTIGIRTPWTLSSESVWNKTRSLGGTLFKTSAAISLLGIIFPEHTVWFILVPILASTFFLFVYSYLLYRKEKQS